MPTLASTVLLALALQTSPAAGGADEPPRQPADTTDAEHASRVGVALYAASPLALGLRYVLIGPEDEPLRGLPVVYGYIGTVGLAAVGAHMYMRSRTEVEPRWRAWWASFVPVAASVAVAMYTPYVDHPAPLLFGGLAASVASFGVVAFTPLGYTAAADPPSAKSPRATLFPDVIALRTKRGPEPALGLTLAF